MWIESRGAQGYLDKLRKRHDACRTERGDAAAIENLIRAAHTYAVAITVEPGHLDFSLRFMARIEDLQTRGIGLEGRWLESRGQGWAWVSPDGTTGRFVHDLPDGVDPALLIHDEPFELETTGRDRLGAVLAMLGEVEAPEPYREDVTAIGRIAGNAWRATAPGARDAARAFYREVATAPLGQAFAGAAPAPGDPFQAALTTAAEQMAGRYAQFAVDGLLLSNAVILAALHRHIVTSSGSIEAARRVSWTGLGPAGTPEDAVGDAVRRAIREGHAMAVESTADDALDAVDDGVAAALAAPDPMAFYDTLRGAAPYAAAAQTLYHCLARSDAARGDRHARAENAAEEHHVRILYSLTNAVMSLEWPTVEQHRAAVRRAFDAEGSTGAEREVLQLIDFSYLYPRAARPWLLPDAAEGTT